MIIYNPYDEEFMPERIKLADNILQQLPHKHCFISGSYLYKEKYKDIDLFIITRSKKTIKLKNKRIKITKIDFNDLHSLFYHSVSKSCIAKNILPKKKLRATMADYWDVINETIPAILNEKTKYHKNIRSLVLHTEFFKKHQILSSLELNKKIKKFSNYKNVLNYIKTNTPQAINKKAKRNYIKRYFYTQAAFHKKNIKYLGQRYLYNITHDIIRGTNG